MTVISPSEAEKLETTAGREASAVERLVMCALDLRIALCEIDNGRFEDIIHTLKLSDECAMCDFFNLSIKDLRQGYRCRCSPSCIAATLHPEIVSYLNWKLGWIEESEHIVNLRCNT